ncbi:conserved unknown protein [Ectocarpus siliculosus]|uniref:Acid phosphatase n=1 Tax=Ectocarpus siliculosus TaxID=2880 RepID=D8LBW8_ECTSI|nr:conserved unknown protein [Ectocarpus siliculosus]|eukprot:CBN79151.1 conserved unknown protein [Ectocarpus siliculosus]
MVAGLLPRFLCGHLTPLSYVHPMFAPQSTRLLRGLHARGVGRPLCSKASGSETQGLLSLLVFHRHGDRSPLRGHTPDEELALPTAAAPAAPGNTRGGSAVGTGDGGGSEKPGRVAAPVRSAENFWRGQLVPPEVVRRLDELYPVKRSPGEAVPPDKESAPFGCLTSLGLQQLQDRGEQFRQRYSCDDIDNAKLEVFSTNYRRTQLSAQGFLDGLLRAGGRGGVPVVVRPRADDFLNQWESRGHEMYERMMVVESEPDFRVTEETVGGPLKRRLHALDPALFPLPQGGRFRWMMAADYFMSARARGLRVAPELDALGTATIRHLVWRFSRFYGDDEMMRTMVGPLLAHIIECAAGSDVAGPATGSRNVPGADASGGSLSRVVSSSCHDVTILALLYAMEADLLEDRDYWPPYGSTIAFEVSSTGGVSGPGRGPRGGRGEDKGGGGDLVLKISVDGEPLRSRLFAGKGGDGIIPLSDFHTAVRSFLPTAV